MKNKRYTGMDKNRMIAKFIQDDLFEIVFIFLSRVINPSYAVTA